MQEHRQTASRASRRVRITVRGRLSEYLATAFDGMQLVSRRGQTDLLGEVVDQAQLYALLARVRDLGLELEGLCLFPDTTTSEVHQP